MARSTADSGVDADATQTDPPIDHVSIAVLGVLTICAYGSWYYAFGVLLDPIIDDTGWRESTLAASFSAGTVLVGFGSLFGGRLLDRVGHRVVFALGAALSASFLIVGSFAASMPVFFGATVVAAGALGALGFYHVTMTAAVRLNPSRAQRAIAELTVWGAFSSAIYLPAVSALDDRFGWRTTMRVMAVVVAVAFVAAALLRAGEEDPDAAPMPSLGSVLRSVVGAAEPRLFAVAIAFAGVSMSTVLAYQVPAMTSAGLTAGTAATIAGLRGFCQLLGRLPLAPLVERIGIDRALVVAFGAVSVGGIVLMVAGSVPVAVLFAAVAGFGIGAHSPLQGMKSEALFARDGLGATMGVYGALMLLCGSVGPVLTGILVDRTGQRWWAGVVISVSAALAVAAVIAMRRAGSAAAAA